MTGSRDSRGRLFALLCALCVRGLSHAVAAKRADFLSYRAIIVLLHNTKTRAV